MPYDPVLRHQAVEESVTRDSSGIPERKYYRWRVDRWYGGIVTADVVGCGLYCRFCWVSDFILNNPLKAGEFHAPRGVADKLIGLLRKNGLKQVRVSGGEPTIGSNHLFHLLDFLRDKGCRFVLETNGILLGYDRSYARGLSEYDFLHVRLSLKGCNEEEFAVLTGANPSGFTFQIESLRNLADAGVSCHPSVITSFSTESSFNRLKERIMNIDPLFLRNLEVEELILYPKVVHRLRKYGLKPYVSHHPNRAS